MAWDKITDSTIRLEVPGGWIYRMANRSLSGGITNITCVFVPDPCVYAPVGRLNHDPEPRG